MKLRDILDIIPSPTVILKIDVEGYECKVTDSNDNDKNYNNDIDNRRYCLRLFSTRLGSTFPTFSQSGSISHPMRRTVRTTSLGLNTSSAVDTFPWIQVDRQKDSGQSQMSRHHCRNYG